MSLSVSLPNSVKVVQGKTDKITRCLICMVESRDVNNLPYGGHGQQGHDYPKEIKESFLSYSPI